MSRCIRSSLHEKLKETGAKILEIDFLDEKTIVAAAKEYGSEPLDMLINCAGKLLEDPTFREKWHLIHARRCWPRA